MVREVGARVGGIRASNSHCTRDVCWGEVAGVGVGIACCNHHNHTCAHCRIDSIPHACNHSISSQAHASDRWANRTGCQPIQSLVNPLPSSTSLITQDLDTPGLSRWCNSIDGADSSPGAMRAVTLNIPSTTCVTIALHEVTTGHIRTRSSTATEISVRVSHTRIENEHRRRTARPVALVCNDAVQTPCGRLHIGFQLWNCRDHRIWLDILCGTLGLTQQLLELSLSGTDCEEWHTACGGVTHSLAIAVFAQGGNLLVSDASVHNHVPILFRVFGLSQRVALVCEVVIQNWDARDELGLAEFVPIDPGPISQDCGQTHGCCEACWHGV